MADFTFDDNGSTDGGAGGVGGVEVPPDGGPGSVGGNADGNIGVENVIDGGTGKTTPDIGPATTKKRGRKPLPRDAAGNIIRDGADAGSTRVQKAAKLDLGFTPNDRAKVLANIAGIHGFIAVLTQTPVMNLTMDEAKAMTNSLCDVADYHKINLTGAGGPWGLYVALGLTSYSIYKPRLAALRAKRVLPANGPQPAAPATPDNVTQMKPRNMMDFSADIQAEMNNG